MRPLAVLVLALLASTPAGAKRRPLLLACPDGRFTVNGPALMDTTGTMTGDTIVVRDGHVTVGSGCGSAALVVTRKGAGMELRARWARCGALRRVRLTARFGVDCDVLGGTVVVKKGRRTLNFVARRQVLGQGPTGGGTTGGNGGGGGTGGGGGGEASTTTTTLPTPTLPDGTFRVIDEQIFARRGCVAASCHGAAASAGLRLDDVDTVYENLVGVAATTPGANGQLRVSAGDAQDSFLSRKLHGTLGPDEGARMPLGLAELPVIERDLVDIWINGGAPKSGDVPGAPVLSPTGYVPADPLPPPPAPGVQFVLDGPMLEPGHEIEGCMWVPTPNTTDVLIQGVELTSNPGTHHIAVWRYSGGGTPPDVGQWRAGDVACLSSGASLGSPLGGTAVATFSTTSWGKDVASVLPGNTWVGLNAHFYNEFDVPIQVKFWINYLPFVGTPLHVMQGITSLDTTFGISVPPFTQATRRGRYVNQSGTTQHILWLGGHMHKRGLRFTAWLADGTTVFIDTIWDHPTGRVLDPPFALAPGDWFDYECLEDNGVLRPVRRDAAGNPTTLTFGISAEDEMCILVGNYYSD